MPVLTRSLPKVAARAAALFALSVASLFAAEPATFPNGIVVAGEPLAARIGVRVLESGGNAFDAAVAVGFALAVTSPYAGNLGGGGFAVARCNDGRLLALDFRETAPRGASRDMYLDESGDPVPGMSEATHRAVGVPGTVDGLLRMLREEGTRDLSELLAPSIAMARDGIPCPAFLHRALAAKSDFLTRWPATAAVFFPNGAALAAGNTLCQPDLARTLERIAADGPEGFYDGEVAEQIVAEMERHGGIVTREDLRGYRSKWREPFVFRSGRHEIVTHPLPSSGGITLAQILGLVDLDSLENAGFQSMSYVAQLVEAERLAYADRNHHLGDTDFVDVPVERLVAADYLRARRREMPEKFAGRSRGPRGVGAGDPEATETTHYCVADRWGNVVSVTTTVNGWFGMGALVDGAGFFLNNEMDDFSAKPGVPNRYGLVGAEANAIAAGKRMLSSMTPTIVMEDGEFLLAVGSPGGSTIITTVLQIFLNVTRFDMNVRDAIDAGRFHHQWLPDVVYHEPFTLSPDTIFLLESWGYTVEERSSPIGRAAAIVRNADGSLSGAFDSRGDGLAAGH